MKTNPNENRCTLPRNENECTVQLISELMTMLLVRLCPNAQIKFKVALNVRPHTDMILMNFALYQVPSPGPKAPNGSQPGI